MFRNELIQPTGELYTVNADTPRAKSIVRESFAALNHMAKSVNSAADGEKLQYAVIGQEWKPLPYLLSITNLLLHDIEAPNIRHCDSLATPMSDFTDKDKVDVIGMNPPYGGSTDNSVKSNFPLRYQSSEPADDCPEGFKTKETWFYRLDMPEGYKHFSKTKPMRLEHTRPIQEWWNNRQEIVSEETGEKSRVFTPQQLVEMGYNFDQCKFPKEEEQILPPAELLKQYFEQRAALDQEIDSTLAEIQRMLGIELL